MKLSKLMILAPDLEVAKGFYSGVLGFRILEENPSDLVLAHDGADIVIFKCGENAVSDSYASNARTVFVLAVDSLDTEIARLRARGVSVIHDRPGINRFGRYAAIRDLFGNILELMEEDRPPETHAAA